MNTAIQEASQEEREKSREKEIIKASIVGIAGNMLLVIFKLFVGLMSHSIAIILDGVNNATDALSSVVTIVGTKLAGRQPNRQHPFGFGRIEYLTSMLIAVIILVAGLVSLRESIEKVIHPSTPSYSTITIVIILVAIAAKIAIGFYFKRMGTKTNSGALLASSVDSYYDAVLSAGTLVVAFVQNFFDLNIDGIVGIIISLVVCKAGIDVLREALGPLIGQRNDEQFAQDIIAYVNSFPEVHGTYDLLLDNFGPNQTIGSIHIEVADDMTARQIHKLTRDISEGVYKKFATIITIGIYADNSSGQYAPIHDALGSIVKDNPKVLQTHGFYVDSDEEVIYFDLVIDFDTDATQVRDNVVEAMKLQYPSYEFNVIIDTNYDG